MSMRIQNDGIAAPAAPPSSPAENIASSGSSVRSASEANGATDQVCLSSLSGSVAASGSALADQQAARVSHLAAVYARGDYQPDSMQISRALISGAVAGGSFEEDS